MLMKLFRFTRYISLCFPSMIWATYVQRVVWDRQLTRGDFATDHQSVIHWSVGLKFAWTLLPFTLSIRLSTNWPLMSRTLETLRTILVIRKLMSKEGDPSEHTSILSARNRSIRANNEADKDDKVSMLKIFRSPSPCLVTTQWCTQRWIVLEEIADPKYQTQHFQMPLTVHARTAISDDLEHIRAWDAAAAHPGWQNKHLTSEVASWWS